MSTNSHGSFAPLLDPLSPTPSRTRSSSGSSIGSSRQHGSYQDSYRKPFAGGPGNRSSGATTLSQSTVSEKVRRGDHTHTGAERLTSCDRFRQYRGIMDSSSTIQYADGFEVRRSLSCQGPAPRDAALPPSGTVPTKSNFAETFRADGPQDDDDLHNPDPKRDMKADKGGTVFTMRGIENVGCLALLATGLLMLCSFSPSLRGVSSSLSLRAPQSRATPSLTQSPRTTPP